VLWKYVVVTKGGEGRRKGADIQRTKKCRKGGGGRGVAKVKIVKPAHEKKRLTPHEQRERGEYEIVKRGEQNPATNYSQSNEKKNGKNAIIRQRQGGEGFSEKLLSPKIEKQRGEGIKRTYDQTANRCKNGQLAIRRGKVK